MRIGAAAVADGALRQGGLGVTDSAHEWSYEREGFPLYCTHCSFMNEILPLRWIGYPVYPSDPPDDFDRDPCTWYWYKDPADIPERFAARYGSGDSSDRPEAPEVGVATVLAELGRGSDEVRLTRIPGGASRETWLVEAAGKRFVLRRDPPGSESLVPQEGEARLIRLAGDRGVPVPQILHVEPAGGRFGTAGILMQHVAGESIAPRLLRKPEFERACIRLPAQLGAALARIHSIPVGETGLEVSDADPLTTAVEQWERMLDEIPEPLPVVEAGLRWLRAKARPPRGTALLHGDFRLGNFIINDGGLRAVIDWELAHLGDPVEDIGWLCIRSWRFGNDSLPVAGVGTLKPFLDAYVRAGGTRPDPERLRFWEVFGNLKWAVICARQAHDHLSGDRRSHELAALGRRICEPEWDMLDLIGRTV